MIRNKLSFWKDKFLLLGGRVILINSILNFIPIYTLSFYKASCKVLNEIHSIMDKFLWRGLEDKRVIHRMSWEHVCQPKEDGGLGIINLEVFNKAFLMKCKWRILNDKCVI